MKKVVQGLVGVLSVCLVAGAVAQAQEEFPQPEVTRFHKILKRDVGMWDAQMKLWMGEAGSEPITCQGQERNVAVGDLWVVSRFEAEIAGQKFVGSGQVGYDPLKKKFIGTWVDTMSTSISTMEGTWDDAAKELTSIMISKDPATGQDVKSKSVARYTDKDTREFTMYMQKPGSDEWVKSMEIHYKRRAVKAKTN